MLKALSQYRFLTVEQMLRLGISKNQKSLRDKTLFTLRHLGHIHSEKIGSFLPDVHHLTPKGHELIEAIEGFAQTPASKRSRQPFSALFARHRFAQVDFHIGLRQWIDARGDAEISLALQDFISAPRTRRDKPKPSTELNVPELVNTIIPDGTFAVSLDTGQTAVYLVEIHRSTQSKAVTEQLSRYFEVIKSGIIAKKYGIQANPIICSVHHQSAVLTSVKARLNAHQGFAPFNRNFVFKSLDSLTEDFAGGWHFADDTSANPFPLSKPSTDEES
ncbi:MAG: replication-relaxation family protein [Pseudomonadota bacterium]